MEVEVYLASITAAKREISLLPTPGTVSYNNYPPPNPFPPQCVQLCTTVSFSLY